MTVDEFKHLLKAPIVTDPRLVEVSPDLARVMLSQNTNNRKISRLHVDLLKDEILSDKWQVTPNGVAFDKNGVLKDGQHRLHAIVEANQPAKIFVTFGLDPDSVDYIDIGKTKSIGTIFEYEYKIKDGIRKVAVCSFYRSVSGKRKKDTVDGIFNAYRMLQPEIDWAFDVMPTNNRKGISAPVMMSLTMFRLFNSSKAEEFVSQFKDGFVLGRDDPMHHFIQILDKEKTRGGMAERMQVLRKCCNVMHSFSVDKPIKMLRDSDVGFKYFWAAVNDREQPGFDV